MQPQEKIRFEVFHFFSRALLTALFIAFQAARVARHTSIFSKAANL
jgi:hypothetical protein